MTRTSGVGSGTERALAAGGDAAAEARWEELWSDTLTRTGYGLCQWALDNGRPGVCARVVKEDGQVYCAKHNRKSGAAGSLGDPPGERKVSLEERCTQSRGPQDKLKGRAVNIRWFIEQERHEAYERAMARYRARQAREQRRSIGPGHVTGGRKISREEAGPSSPRRTLVAH